MAKRKDESKYNFAGGGELKSMGAAWFVGFCYALYIDPTYTKWIYGSPNGLMNNRLGTYKRVVNKKVHEFEDAKEEDLKFRNQFVVEFWLRKVLAMNKLDMSNIDEDQETIKRYARLILSYLEKYVFEGVISEVSTDGKKVFFKLRGTDGFFVKRPSEKDKYEENNVFINGNYKESRLCEAEKEFSINHAGAFKDFLMQAFNANKKVCLEFSAVGLLNALNECPKIINLDEILRVVKIL